jgi:hypothetical protein
MKFNEQGECVYDPETDSKVPTYLKVVIGISLVFLIGLIISAIN